MSESRSHRALLGRSRPGRRSTTTRSASYAPGDFPVVGIGASAGGLDACQKLVGALTPSSGKAFILVQHLDPTHESMLVDLLSNHTSMAVRQAVDGMLIERDTLYVIPPGAYLSAGNGAIHLEQVRSQRGARLPFDHLLNSLADEYGARAICVILSGTGADGSAGLKAVKERGGFVIAQDPDEASYDGMPRNAITTGAVDLVLPLAQIADALGDRRLTVSQKQDPQAEHWLESIIELLRVKTEHDFRLYKRGTLQRRIEQRMALSGIETDHAARYLERLHSDVDELSQLAQDLLINVTSFFRDPHVFAKLAETIIPDIVRTHAAGQPLRVWVAGCSSGEETYSLAMLFREELAAVKSDIKLQIFASDVDVDAINSARDGLYPHAIEADVSPARLGRFFSKEERGYRVVPALRACIVFAVQDVLADPPFSRIDFVSCRNLLIYLLPAAQAKVIDVLHFALRDGGILLLGASESAGDATQRFTTLAKAERLYRRTGPDRPHELGHETGPIGAARVLTRPARDQPPSRQAALAELCRQLVLEAYAPAAVLINHKFECLYYLGATDRYLKVAPGRPSHDLLAMARDGLRTKLRAAIQQASQSTDCVVIAGRRLGESGETEPFNVSVRPVLNGGEQLFLVCFVDELKPERADNDRTRAEEIPRVAELEKQLEATRTELESAIRNLEMASEEQKTVNEEALSVNEEYQSTNEELLTSKEELQSLNEELIALNSQLHETLDRQRTTSNDLQNILYSTDVATLFLDTDLAIRFFTPATKSLFNVIPSDIGRPLSDLSSGAVDGELLADAHAVLQTLSPVEREIETKDGAWYIRRILPYRTQDQGVEGVVITFADITERHRAANALAAAEQKAQLANTAKSRFLAAASHDLRQPLQSLALYQGLLAKTVEGERAQKLVARLGDTLGAMTSMLNTLLDINQIEAGTVRVDIVTFPIKELLLRLRDEFTYEAQAQGLSLRVVPCGLMIHSDPRLLEQMIRNLLSNALKYTTRGKILLGCRRRKGKLSIEIWDTGVGIPGDALQEIFDEHHQLGNAPRDRRRGLGLGLSIVQRLGNLLDHRVTVRSRLNEGSVFAIEVALPQSEREAQRWQHPDGTGEKSSGLARRNGTILVVEDDPEVRELLELVLKDEGHRVLAACDGNAAMDLVAKEAAAPDLILADYNLPNGANGLQISGRLREKFHRPIPIVILTGDISTGTLREIASHDCMQLNKPVRVNELTQTIQCLLPEPHSGTVRTQSQSDFATYAAQPLVYVVDDDAEVCEALGVALEADGKTVRSYASSEAFLDAYRPGRQACLLVDAYLPGMSGLELLQKLSDRGDRLPAIMITGHSDVSMAVTAMKAGALDFIEKPVGKDELMASVKRALEQAEDSGQQSAWRAAATKRLAGLTPRQHQIMAMVLAGHPSKNIAADLGVSQRTVENHRAAIMKRTGCKSLPELARLALAVGTGN